ncbi:MULTISPECIES: hypothetical protein [Pseudomonas]|jgi:hypothetical protein|uniref:Uncharacterized protein n=2 Tax=Pseudomonas TaxID=286 RepID=A0A4Y9TGN1_PSEFL|nr:MULTISPECIES: hypothetical protein [Pseudomonas]CRM87401.1 hypothetical protein [Pseudomonas sp. 22 E 5]MCX9150542.1 hypothetical protein [Pseudomonas sp. TB1-B1]QXH65060.1 hypothetical protein KSS96_15635 [Pseudomonas asgharzadehiana]TFW42067.1 hypothetical protein E4T65_16865 [Pseudomonas fluorescens]TKJ62223.1 hypothetical protein PspCFBP13506_14410 [Pseudomonas sp. CFBP13506]
MKKLIQGLDGPRTAQQALFYDLEDAAAIVGWAVVELTAMPTAGSPPSTAATLAKICALLTAQQEKLDRYAAEAKSQRIIRSEGDG